MRFVSPSILILTAVAVAQPTLPPPTGRHPVGRTSLQWTNSKSRELHARVWYPAAKRTGEPATYFPEAGSQAASMANLFGPAWTAISAGSLRSHAYEQAAPLSGSRLPVLIFSPGGGVPSIGYTTQLEDLASHGYVVIALEHAAVAPVAGASPDKAEQNTTESLAVDIVFMLDRLQELPGDSLFTGRLDLTRIGVFGHSRGGRTAARVCQLDPRVKACLNQDGSFSWHPFWLDANGRNMEQPFMMLDHLDAELPDAVFSQMKTTREEYNRRRSARQAEAREKIYGTIAGGSYHVTIKTPGISHNSFTDVRLLGRPDAAAINSWPKDVQAATPNEQILRQIAAYTRAFFDRHLRGARGTLPKLTGGASADIEIRRYGVSKP